jgi:hypothetical protein
MRFAQKVLDEPGHCSECRDRLEKGILAFRALDLEAAPKLCVHCVENIVKMEEFRKDFLERLNKNGWFNEQDS